MDSIGAMLHRARDERGLTLDEVAARTRINRKYLDAIERGDRESIPGGFFYKSFVRQYAAVVCDKDSGLAGDIEAILAEEQPAAPPEHDNQVLKAMTAKPPQERAGRSRNISTATYAILLILALAGSSGLYMWWHWAQQAHAAGETPPAHRPEASSTPPQPQQTAPNTPPVTQQSPPVPQASAAPPPSPDAKIVLDIAATEPTWFQVWSDGKSVFSGVLKSGESKTFAAKDGARMKVGNAGGIEVKFNGKPIGAIGTRGQIRTVVFTPAGAEVVKAPPVDEG
jgi:cytoskeleton protein RodZ